MFFFFTYISKIESNRDSLMTNSNTASKIILDNLHILLHKILNYSITILLSHYIICIEKETKLNIRVYKQK